METKHYIRIAYASVVIGLLIGFITA